MIKQQQIQAYKSDPINKDFLIKSFISDSASQASIQMPPMLMRQWPGPGQEQHENFASQDLK
jgi:hypothetical protein